MVVLIVACCFRYVVNLVFVSVCCYVFVFVVCWCVVCGFVGKVFVVVDCLLMIVLCVVAVV